MIYVLMILGIGLLVFGADLLVRGASKIASEMGISSLVIGLTVVAFGTSSPEMAVSVQAALAGNADIALGNVVGSNICNILLILGASAVIVPLVVNVQLLKRDMPIMIGISFMVYVMAKDGVINRYDGGVLFAGVILYTTVQILSSRKQSQAAAPTTESFLDEVLSHDTPDQQVDLIALEKQGVHESGLGISAAQSVIGLVLLTLGARWFVAGAVAIAEILGVDQLVIGLTVVAVGTSLPEIATSIVAAIRGERDIAIGNVVGSNIFNLLAVLGLAAVLGPAGVRVPDAAMQFDLPVMIAVSVVCLPIFLTGREIARWEGALFLIYYAVYTIFLVLQATQHPTLPGFMTAVGWVALPLTGLLLVVSLVRAGMNRAAARL